MSPAGLIAKRRGTLLSVPRSPTHQTFAEPRNRGHLSPRLQMRARYQELRIPFQKPESYFQLLPLPPTSRDQQSHRLSN